MLLEKLAYDNLYHSNTNIFIFFANYQFYPRFNTSSIQNSIRIFFDTNKEVLIYLDFFHILIKKVTEAKETKTCYDHYNYMI